jgi:hypothetical protein
MGAGTPIHRRLLAVAAIVLLARGVAVAGSPGSCAELIDEFYRGWPCQPPTEELEQRARDNAVCLSELITGIHDEKTSLAAYELLMGTDEAAYPGVVLEAVRDVRPAVRGRAVHDLPRALGGRVLQGAYIRLLDDPALLVRYNAIGGLAPYPTPDAVPRLSRMLGDESIEVRHFALDILARWNLAGTTDELTRLSHDRDPTVAGVAAFGLARYYHRDAKLSKVDRYLGRELRTLVGPPYAGTDEVVALIGVLGAGSNPSRFRALHLAAEHMHPAVRTAARDALSSKPSR